MAELADALGSGSSPGSRVGVQVPLLAQKKASFKAGFLINPMNNTKMHLLAPQAIIILKEWNNFLGGMR